MLALRFIGLLALAVWVGGLIAIGGIAAPAIFDTIALRQVTDGRLLAGAVFGATLERFHLLSYGCAGVAFVSLVARGVLGPRPRRFAIRMALLGMMLVAAVYSGVVVSAQVERAQAGIGTSSLPADDSRRLAFGKLHAQSTAVQIVPLLGGLVLLLFELRD
jgi:hypothetical protein